LYWSNRIRVCSRSRLSNIHHAIMHHSNMVRVAMSRSRNRGGAYVSACRHRLRFLLHTSRSCTTRVCEVEPHSHQKLSGRYQDYRSRCLWPRPCDTGFIPHRRVRKFRSIPQKSGRYGFIIIPSHHVPDRIGVDGQHGQAMNRC
jgi:hypothetical protein